jgi:diguanylate cyclase (GGDEF)-like protein
MQLLAALDHWGTATALALAAGAGYGVGWIQRWWILRRTARQQRRQLESILESAAAWHGDVDADSTLAHLPLDPPPRTTCQDLADFESALLAQIDRLIAYEQRLQADLRSARTLLTHRSAELKVSHAEARRDPLSALFNRRGFDEMLQIYLQSRRAGRQFAVILIDIDHFKRINDLHGHLTGDQVLAWVGTRLMEVLRPTDCVARFGGDEFAVLLREVQLEQARAVAARLLQAFRDRPFVSPDYEQEVPVTLSIGLAAADLNDSGDSLVRKADAALYRSKAEGRNRLSVYELGTDSLEEFSERHLAEACPVDLSTD